MTQTPEEVASQLYREKLLVLARTRSAEERNMLPDEIYVARAYAEMPTDTSLAPVQQSRTLQDTSFGSVQTPVRDDTSFQQPQSAFDRLLHPGGASVSTTDPRTFTQNVDYSGNVTPGTAIVLKAETVAALKDHFGPDAFSYDDLLMEWLTWRSQLDSKLPGNPFV